MTNLSEQSSNPIQQGFERLHTHFLKQKSTPLSWRIQQLKQLARMLRQHQDSFSQALASDLGKSATEAWVTEIGFLLKDIAYTLKHLRTWAKPQRTSNPLVIQPVRSFIQPEPRGVVLIIGAWNYPLQLLLSPAIAAIAAGNCMYLKPSEVAPATSALLNQLLPQYVDQDCIQCLEGDANTVTTLLALPFDHIFYTGGSAVAKIVMRAAAEQLTPVTLELGGKSPAIISRHSNIAATARRIIWGKFTNAGQTCIAPDYLLVDKHIHTELVQELRHAVTEFYGDNPQQSKDYGRLVAERHVTRLAQLLAPEQLGQAKVYGGEYDLSSRYFAPTLVDGCLPDHALMQEEIFGPILPIIPVPNLTSAFAFVRSRSHPLACYLFSQDRVEQQQAERFIQCGSLCINDTLVFMLNPKLPFGGVRASGMGRYHGRWGFDTFSHLKPVMKRSFWFDTRLRYPPYSAKKSKLLKKLFS